MPSVEELLSQTSEEVETYADTGIEYCTVDDDTRLVTIPDKYKKLGVESDEKVKRIWFRFPKLVGNNGVDLSAIGVRVNFRNANGDGDIYIVEDLTTDGDYVIFSWELTRKVTSYKGNVSFVVCAVKSATDGTIKNEWNTTLNKECEVLEGLEVTEQIAQENPDIIEYILANLGGSVSAEQIAQAVEEYMIAHPFTETDPTVSDWAKQPEKPIYTASEVGADESGTAESKVSEHNISGTAHNDIRLLVQGLTERLNALADSDDTTLDQMSEVVAYIKSNKSLIDAITTSKVNVSDIIDNLTTNVSNKPLSAAQGVKLKALIDAIAVPTKLSELENDSGYAKTTDIPDKLPNPQKLTFTGAVTAEYDGSGAVTVEIPSGGDGSTGQDITITPLASGTIPSGTEKVFTHTGITFGQLNNYKRIAISINGAANSGSNWAITHNEDGTSWKMIDLTTQRGYIELRKVASHIWDVLFKTNTNVSNGFSSAPHAPYLTVNNGSIAGTFMFNFTLTQNDEICIYNKSTTTADVNWAIQGMNF